MLTILARVLLIATLTMIACQPASEQRAANGSTVDLDSLFSLQTEAFVDTIGGAPTSLYWLTAADNIRVAITNYGGRIVGLWVKDTAGQWTDVVLGMSSLPEFREVGERYYGATIGRYGNRIGAAQFDLDGNTYQLPANNGPNTLHGGPSGFHEQVWTVAEHHASLLRLRYQSPAGDMGFPGNLTTIVTFELTEAPGLRISYQAETDAPTVVNLTNHAFFNLNGEGSGSINQHQLMIHADAFTPVDSSLIPTGEVRPVSGTPFDFRSPTPIGARLDQPDQQLAHGGGYDHNFVITEGPTDTLHLSAVAIGDQTGIRMEVWSQEPGLQFYGGNFMDGSHSGKSGRPYGYRHSFCLETQHFPDSPNQPGFPSTVLRPGETYQSLTEYRFGQAD